MRTAKTLQQALDEGMSEAVEVGDCLEWQGRFHQRVPVARVRLPGTDYTTGVQVPRKIWEAKNGPVPEGKLIYRGCCNSACVLEDHLVCGTRQEWAKCRKKARLTRHAPSTIAAISAARRKQSAYSVQQVLAVKQLAAVGASTMDIVAATGVCFDMVQDIRAQKSWATVGNPFAQLMRQPERRAA